MARFLGDTAFATDARITTEFPKYKVVHAVGSDSLAMDSNKFLNTGSTDIQYALAQAHSTISGATATNKRVVLISDGISQTAVKDSSALKSFEDDASVTLDVVAWGPHADRVMM